MKRIIIIAVIFFVAIIANAQPFNFQSALNYWDKGKGKLDKAKDAIDKASLDAKTSTWPKTWFLRGAIYFDIAASEKYKNLDTNGLSTSFNAFLKGVQIDDKNEYLSDPKNIDIMIKMLACEIQYFYDKGIKNYNLGLETLRKGTPDKKLFKDALSNFETTMSYSSKLAPFNPKMKDADTLTQYYAAMSAERCEKLDVAENYYNKLIKQKPKNLKYYMLLQKVYKMAKDTAKALETINKALEIKPDNLDFIIEQTNIYLAKGQTEKAQQNLYKAIEKDPNNFNLYYAIGANYNKIYEDTSKSMPERLTAYQQAEKEYLKTIEIKPDFLDANYNLGALYLNESIRIFEQANKIQDQKKYESEKVKAEAILVKATPYLEKALQIQQNDKNPLMALKQIYARTKQYDKAKEMNERPEKLKSEKK
jgi:tetratricopeptide (TPR) repeat protein